MCFQTRLVIALNESQGETYRKNGLIGFHCPFQITGTRTFSAIRGKTLKYGELKSNNLKRATVTIQINIFLRESSIASLNRSGFIKEAPAGLNTVKLDAGNLKAGVYFYQLKTGLKSQVRCKSRTP
jgi:hypothetical protein